MKAPLEAGWEKTLNRYFAANGVPLTWAPVAKRFTGIYGHTFARLNPRREESAWARMPERFSPREEESKGLVMFVTNKVYGDTVEDSFVVLRLGTFTPMLKAFIDMDKERWLHAAND